MVRWALEDTMASATQSERELFRELVAALNDRDFEAFAATHADDVVLHDHDETVHGIDAAIAHETANYEAFPDMRYDVDDVVAEDGVVAGRWTVTGTHEGAFEGIPPTNETIELSATGFMHVDDGEITEVWLTYDRLGMLQQLGVADAPTE